MSISRTTNFGVPRILSLLVLGIFLGLPLQQVRGENAETDTDLLFECVQTTYGQTPSGEKSVQFSVVSKESTNAPQKNADAASAVSKTQAEPGAVRIRKAEAKQSAASAPKTPAPNTTQIPDTISILEPVPAQTSAPAQTAASILTEAPAQTVTPVQAISPVPETTVERIVPQPPAKGPVIRKPTPEAVPVHSHVGSNSDQSLGDDELETVGPFQIYRESEELSVISKRSLLMRTRYNLHRTAIVDPAICDIVQFTPREICIIGRAVGSTHVTFWFEDGTYKPITFVVNTKPDPNIRDNRVEQFRLLEEQIARMFPNSKVSLILLANKLIIRGQVRCVEEASEILRILREDTSKNSGLYSNTAVSLDEETGMPVQSGLIIVNQLRIPGIQQVSLKVKLADLSRSNGTSSGVDFSVNFSGDKVLLQSLMGAMTGGGGLLSYTSADVKVGLNYLVSRGVVRQMSESTLVTMSGTSASMVTGGEIPIPTVTGVSGASAISTSFRPYGTVINFLPTVLDKDLIRLTITSEFSSLSSESNSVSGVPNIDSRTINSQVQLREGQTFALGTTLEDNYSADTSSNIPIISDLIANRNKSRGEREMVILVSPELVAPMEPDEVPPLPGFDVTEPSNVQFHILGKLEGNPTRDYRSTVWPSLRNRYLSGGSAIISGPYGH